MVTVMREMKREWGALAFRGAWMDAGREKDEMESKSELFGMMSAVAILCREEPLKPMW